MKKISDETKLQLDIVREVVTSLYQTGDLTDEEVSDTNKLKKKLGKILKTTRFEPVVNYTDSILNQE